MNKQANEVVMMDSDNAASIRTVTGWVDRQGRFWGNDEYQARWSGSTHRKCPNNPTEHPIYPTNGYCEICSKEKRQAKFGIFPRVAWTGQTLVIFDTDTYFFDTESLVDYCCDNEVLPSELQLVICIPNHVPQFDILQHCEEIMPEDNDISYIPETVQEAVEALNKAIKESDVVSWSQGELVAMVSDDILNAEQKASILAGREARDSTQIVKNGE